MNLVKRLTTTVSASFDWMISQVENHEALVTSALAEMGQASAKARVQLARVQKDGDAMKSRLNQLNEAQKTWSERAVTVSRTDEKRAIECVKRRNQARRDIASLQSRIQEHSKLESALNGDLRLIEERIGELNRKKNAYAARQYRAEALRSSRPDEIGMMQGIDDLFDRWELRLAECEIFTAHCRDSFSDEFVAEEEEAGLKNDLADLLRDQA